MVSYIFLVYQGGELSRLLKKFYEIPLGKALDFWY